MCSRGRVSIVWLQAHQREGICTGLRLGIRLALFLRDGNQCSNESSIHSSRLLLADSWWDHSVKRINIGAILKEKR
jgi:hypothetical protein